MLSLEDDGTRPDDAAFIGLPSLIETVSNRLCGGNVPHSKIYMEEV